MSRGTSSAATLAAVLMGFASPAWAKGDDTVAVEVAAASLAPNEFVWADTATSDPVRVVINVAEQRAYVYRGEALIAATTI